MYAQLAIERDRNNDKCNCHCNCNHNAHFVSSFSAKHECQNSRSETEIRVGKPNWLCENFFTQFSLKFEEDKEKKANDICVRLFFRRHLHSLIWLVSCCFFFSRAMNTKPQAIHMVLEIIGWHMTIEWLPNTHVHLKWVQKDVLIKAMLS